MATEIDSPFLWFSQLVNGTPKPWRHFRIDGVMVNAYEIIRKRRIDALVRQRGIHDYLGFDGPIVMDSGGFLFMKKRTLDVDPQRILELYETSQPDFGVILDHPLEPNLPLTERRSRQMRTLKNTEYMVKLHKNQNPELFP